MARRRWPIPSSPRGRRGAAELRHGVGIVRVEREGPPQQAFGLGVAAGVVVDRRQGLQGEHARRVQFERPTGGLKGPLAFRVGLLGGRALEAHGVEVHPAKHRPGRSVLRVAADPGLQALPDRLVQRGVEAPAIGVGAQQAGVGRHTGAAAARQPVRHPLLRPRRLARASRRIPSPARSGPQAGLTPSAGGRSWRSRAPDRLPRRSGGRRPGRRRRCFGRFP